MPSLNYEKKSPESGNKVRAQEKFIPALGYGWLTGVYDLVIRLTMPETAFRNRLVIYKPQDTKMSELLLQ